MKRYITLYFLVLFLMTLSSCKKTFLDVEDNGVIILQQYVKDLKTTEQYLNSIYLPLSGLYAEYSYIYPELIADNIKPRTNNYINHYNWSQIVELSSGISNKNSDGYWASGYRIIRTCNFVLKKAQEFRSENTAVANDLIAKAYTIRALIHFNLVNIFAQPYVFTSGATHPGIPYITTDDWSESVSRQTVKEVYTGIISDLNESIPLFSSDPGNTLYININAAKALLARVYLYKEDFAGAKNIARNLISSKPLMPVPNYPSKLFTLQESEALFQIPPSWTNVNGGTYSIRLAGLYFGTPLYQFNATNDVSIILKEDPNDVRNTWVTQQAPGVWNITKFPKNVEPGFPAGGGMSYYQTVFRSSEMYLVAAESYARLNNEDSARYYLDAIRMRASVSALPSSATGSALLDSIYKERRKELSFESLRMYDLLRWKKGVVRQDANIGSPSQLPYPSDKAIAPLPGYDVTLAGLPQNPGY